MRNNGLSAIEQTLQQLVAGQAELREAVIGRLDGIDKRLDAHDNRFDRIDKRFDGIDKRLEVVDRRLDKLEIGQESLSEKFDWLGEKQDGLEQAMARGFKEMREEFNERLIPIETAVRRLSGRTPRR